MMPVVAVFLLLLGCLALVTSRYRYRTRPLGRREIHDACDALMLRAACVEHERMDARLRALLDESRRMDGVDCTTSGEIHMTRSISGTPIARRPGLSSSFRDA